ncbi:unnamed protein product [Meloidogyne enterolobii]|uniref:Uncharacterized protein n=1 Tax=Meloidogyne enterolobii TaxID=390850 RepID=A0ACB1AT85_MELEN
MPTNILSGQAAEGVKDQINLAKETIKIAGPIINKEKKPLEMPSVVSMVVPQSMLQLNLHLDQLELQLVNLLESLLVNMLPELLLIIF